MTYEEEVDSLLKDRSLLHLITGLSAEAGEVAGEIQKAVYKNRGIDDDKILDELGDVLFYVTALINHFHSTLEEVKLNNIEKLRRRHG